MVADRNSPQKHVWRAAIVLATADGLGTNALVRATGTSKTAVWRWQEHFASDGVDGLFRDKTRPSRFAPFGPWVGERIAALDVRDGKVVGRCMQRHRHQEFIRFLNAVEKTVPASKPMHAVLDNYAAHKHLKVICTRR